MDTLDFVQVLIVWLGLGLMVAVLFGQVVRGRTGTPQPQPISWPKGNHPREWQR